MLNRVVIISTLWLIALGDHHDCLVLKRSASPDSYNSVNSVDNLSSNYDEYPVGWPKWNIQKKLAHLNS